VALVGDDTVYVIDNQMTRLLTRLARDKEGQTVAWNEVHCTLDVELLRILTYLVNESATLSTLNTFCRKGGDKPAYYRVFTLNAAWTLQRNHAQECILN
jgi:hypothetical protein